jgi:hypothetical protein
VPATHVPVVAAGEHDDVGGRCQILLVVFVDQVLDELPVRAHAVRRFEVQEATERADPRLQVVREHARASQAEHLHPDTAEQHRPSRNPHARSSG